MTVAWSHSVLNSFETCPRRHKLTRITKEVKEPQTEQTRHGNEVHRAFENAIKGVEPLPAKYAQYQPLVRSCVAAPGEKLVEFKFALTDSYKPTAYFAKDVWVRGVIDFALVRGDRAAVVDWKTGKPKPDLDQLKLFALAMFAHRPTVTQISTGFAWVGHDLMVKESFDRQQFGELWSEFLPRVRRLQSAVERDDFPPRPSGLCKDWCPVSRAKCEFSGRK